MTVFLPREGKTIDDVLSEKNGENWESDQFLSYAVDLKLPRINVSTKLQLEMIMSEMGMPTAFSRSAEFPYFCNSDVCISDLFQKAVINLDEEGTEAAAVTVIGVETTGMPQVVTFYANRPFFYTISEQSTGAIFFIGQYMGLGTASPINLTPALSQKEGAIFDLQGRRLSGKPASGIYIENGKKIAIK